ncbi:MAG TPA: EamA family transporter [Spirochaetia bacterium]|nr:EamA family transporter [Spirochaetia bacterium]
MNRRTTIALFVLVCAVFGTTFLAIRLGLVAGASPLFYAGTRFAAAGLILLAAQLIARRIDFAAVRRLFARTLLISLFLTAGTFGTMFWAETRIDSGYMARLDSLGPIVTALFASIALGSRLGRYHLLGFGAGTVGIILLASQVASAPQDMPALIVALVSVVTYAAGMVLYPKLFNRSDDPVTINALQMALGGIVLLIVAPMFETVTLPATASALLPLIYLIVAGSIVGHTANLVVIRNAGPIFASAWLYVAPTVATVAGAIVLGETIGIKQVIGTLCALIGVFFVSRAERAPERSEAATVAE